MKTIRVSSVLAIVSSLLVFCVYSQLTSDSVSEGPCVPDIVSRGAQNVNFLWFAGMRNYYVPIASEACYRGYAEVLLGRPAKTGAEIDSMNLRIRSVFPFPPSFITTGFPDPVSNQTRQIVQICPPTTKNQIMCLPVNKLGSNWTDTRGIGSSRDTVYYTDNATTILIIRCLNEKVKDYKLLTTGPTVDEATRQIVLEKIKELGFNPGLMRTIPY